MVAMLMCNARAVDSVEGAGRNLREESNLGPGPLQNLLLYLLSLLLQQCHRARAVPERAARRTGRAVRTWHCACRTRWEIPPAWS